MKGIRKMNAFFIMVFILYVSLSPETSILVNAKSIIPQVQFADAPITQYLVGDRVKFNIYTPNYGGRVEYRVILWNDSKKDYYDLWNKDNGYKENYYTNWKPYGNNIFTLGWPISEPGSYRITVCVKREGIKNSRTALEGMNCDSYINSVAFTVKEVEVSVDSIIPIVDVIANQGSVPALPNSVIAIMTDGTEKNLKVNWEQFDTSNMGVFVIYGDVEGTNKKAALKLIVNQGILDVYSVYASENIVYVNLNESIDFIPTTGRFSLRDLHYNSLRIKTLTMSTDKKTIQLITEGMLKGRTYILKADGIDYRIVD